MTIHGYSQANAELARFQQRVDAYARRSGFTDVNVVYLPRTHTNHDPLAQWAYFGLAGYKDGEQHSLLIKSLSEVSLAEAAEALINNINMMAPGRRGAEEALLYESLPSRGALPDADSKPAPSFLEELQQLINRHSKENGSDTPDYVLAAYLEGCLIGIDVAVKARDQHGVSLKPR